MGTALEWRTGKTTDELQNGADRGFCLVAGWKAGGILAGHAEQQRRAHFELPINLAGFEVVFSASFWPRTGQKRRLI